MFGLACTGCNATKLPQVNINEGHDAQMGGGTGTGTIGDDATEPQIDNP